jgi:hypothetical protein
MGMMTESKDLIPEGQCYIQPKLGRPTKLTKELIDRICTHIKKGNYIDVSCAYENISKDTYFRWLKEGQISTDPDDLCRIFSDSIRSAEAESIMDMNARMMEHEKNSWKPLGFRMERRFGKYYGKKQEIEVNSNPLNALTAIIEKSKAALKKENKMDPKLEVNENSD